MDNGRSTSIKINSKPHEKLGVIMNYNDVEKVRALRGAIDRRESFVQAVELSSFEKGAKLMLFGKD